MLENRPVYRTKPSLAVPLLIVINLVVYLCWQIPSQESFMESNFLVSWSDLVHGRLWVLIGAAFSHNAFWHFLLNMLVLRSFGPIIEFTIGKRAFITFYLVAGAFSSFCHAFVSAWFLHQPDLPALGASGAISGLVLFFSLTYPREKLLIFGIVPIPAIWGAIAFVGLDLWGLWAQSEGGGFPIGHGAHLGGALAGLIYYLIRRSSKTSALSSSIRTNRFSES